MKLNIVNHPHTVVKTEAALQAAADELGVAMCWFYRGDFHFNLTGDWTVSITPESAERVRVETWSGLQRRDRKWARSGDSNRLRALVRMARDAALHPPDERTPTR